MNFGRTLAVLVSISVVATVPAADEHPEAVKKDLFAVIALEGHHCVRVVSYERKHDTEYVATCENGKRYHIYVQPQGKVAVDKHGKS